MVIGAGLSCESIMTVTKLLILIKNSQEVSKIFGAGLSNTWPILHLNCLFSYLDHKSLWNHPLQLYTCIDRTQ